MAKLTSIHTNIYSDKQGFKRRHDFQIDNLREPRADEFQPKITIPDHTPVTLAGGRGYEWYQGRIAHKDEFAPQKEPVPPIDNRTMRVRVISSIGEPAADAKVHASVWTEEEFNNNQTYVCDGQGVATINLPRTLYILRLWAYCPKHVAQFINWSDDDDNDQKNIKLPDEFTFHLEGGTIISGFVKDDEGNPIVGAKAEVTLVSGRGKIPTGKTAPDTSLAYGPAGKLTDEHGIWLIDNVPAGEDVKVEVRLSHPNFVSDYAWGASQKEQNVTTQQFRDGTGTIVMHRGTAVTGRVTDADGKPVASAVVIWGDHPYGQFGSQETKTDKDGFYQFPPLPTGPLDLTVVARDWAPQMREVDIGPQMPPADFKLQRGKILRLRFVDDQGKPLPDIYVGIDRWCGKKSLYNHRHPNVVAVGIPYQSGADGVFEWTWAPDDEVFYNISGKALPYVPARPFTAGKGEQVVKLPIGQDVRKLLEQQRVR